MTSTQGESRSYRCPSCGREGDASAGSCAGCGVGVDVRLAVTRSGWMKLPPIKDMARIQFGGSVCQIEGTYVPVADLKLAGGDSVYFAHHLLLWKDAQVKISAMSLKKGWKRLMAGLPLVMTKAEGPGRVAFSKDSPGEVIAIPLEAGQSIDVREHVFMLATNQISYDWFSSGIWFKTMQGNDSETHYPVGMFMDRFSATGGQGLLLLHGAGNVFERRLEEGQGILVKPTSLLFKDPSVRMHLHVEHPGGTWKSWRSWGDRYMWLRLVGPGRVAVQSHYEHMEDPGRDLAYIEPMATKKQW